MTDKHTAIVAIVRSVLVVVVLAVTCVGFYQVRAENRAYAQSQSQMQNLVWRGEPRFVIKGPGQIIGGNVHILQDNQTDTCYLLVQFLGQSFTPAPQPCAE